MQRRFLVRLVLAVVDLAMALPAFSADPAQAVSGEVIQVDADKSTIAVKVPMEGGEKTLVVRTDESTQITRGDAPIELGEVRSGEKVAMTYTRRDGILIASRIEVDESAG